MKRKSRIMGVSLVAALAAPSFVGAAENTGRESGFSLETCCEDSTDLAQAEALFTEALRERMLGANEA